MKVNRSGNKTTTTSSSTSDMNNVSVKKVEPQISVDAPDESGASTPKKGGPIESTRNVVSTVVGGLISTIRSGVQDFGSRVTKSVTVNVTSGCEHVGSFLNISTKAAALLLAGSIGLGGTVAGVFVHEYHHMNTILRQEDYEDDCAEEVKSMRASGSVSDVSGMLKRYAEKAWSVCKAMGMSDEQAAAMLGNMQAESGIDPTAVEAVYDEPYNIDGPVKSLAKSDLCEFTRVHVFPAYEKSGWTIYGCSTSNGCSYPSVSGGKSSINCSGYVDNRTGHFVPGIGLCGFTGGNATALLAYAEAANMDWWEFDVQMSFAIDSTGGYGGAAGGAKWIESWIPTANSIGTGEAGVRRATEEFCKNYEGIPIDSDSNRYTYALNWYNEFKGKVGDAAYGATILNLANQIEGGALSKFVAKAVEECETAAPAYGNSSIAEAAVAYAYETTEMGKGNDGTALYRKLHDIVNPAGPYQSCDVGVATAVRWSGADDEFVSYSCPLQYQYLESHPDKWQHMGTMGVDLTHDDLQPGDVMILPNNHTVVFVGHEAVKKKFPGSEAEIVSASYNTRSPGCEDWYSHFEQPYKYEDPKGSGKYSSESYEVYRNIKPEDNPKYVNCVEGMVLDDGS